MDWAALGDNSKYGMVLRQVGSDDLGSGLSIPPYFFLQGSWRIRPMEANHNLTITGNLFVEGGGVPVVSTLGTYQVNVNYTVPVQAQAFAAGGNGGPSASEIAAAVWDKMSAAHTSPGTFGQMINTVSEDVVAMQDQLSTATELIQTLLKYETNRTKIDRTAKTMTVYDDDGVTPLRVFNLRDFTGTASITEVAERAPQ